MLQYYYKNSLTLNFWQKILNYMQEQKTTLVFVDI